MASLDGRNPISSIKGIGTTDNTLFLLSDRFASLNFDGFIPRNNTLIYASDLTIGQTIFASDPTARDNSFFITRIDTEAVTVDSIEETAYSLYFLGQNDLEEKYTYGAENGNGSFSQNHLFDVYKDDISDVVLGNNGWMITNQGNAIFSNVFVRGTVEATSGKIDGILKVGESKNGYPLVTLGKNIFNSTSFEGSSSEHSGLFLNKHNYLMGYDELTDVYVTSIVATNNTQNNILRKATFTLNGHTLAVNDLVSITGFAEDKFLELDNVFPVKEITANTFTIYYKNDISGTTNPISASLKVQSFALNNIYAVTSFSLSQVTTAEETSSVKLYFNNNYTGLFVAGQIIDLSYVLNSSLNINGQYQIISVTEVAGESNDFLTIETPRVVAGTYTTDLGEIILYDTNYKFKVGDDDNSMSYNSYTGALTVTGTINASSGNFTNAVTVGKPNLSYSVSNKQLTTNQATLSTSSVHSFVVGDSVTVSGVDATFNGTYTITAVPTGQTFIYAKTAGNVASIAVSPVGTVSRGIANEGTIFVGYGASQITINGTENPQTSAIFAGVGNFGNLDTGFFVDASGRFSLKDKLQFNGTTLSINGGGTFTGSLSGGTISIGAENSIFKADSNGIYLGNATFASAPFRVTPAGVLTATNANITGIINASGGTFTGTITGGTFIGGKFTTATGALGTNVSGTNDGLYLNASNYFMTNGTATLFRAGTSTNFLQMNSSDASTRLQVDTNNSIYAVEIGGSLRVNGTNVYIYGDLIGTASNAINAGALDSLNSTQFLRSDTSDSFTGSVLTINNPNISESWYFSISGSEPLLQTTGASNLYGSIGTATDAIYFANFNNLKVDNVNVTSDTRTKKDVLDSDLGIIFINNLRPVKFKKIDGKKKIYNEDGYVQEFTPGTRWHYGFIAQELKQELDSLGIDSSMWSLEENEEFEGGLQTINYLEMISPAIKAIQELSEMVISLQNRLAALES